MNKREDSEKSSMHSLIKLVVTIAFMILVLVWIFTPDEDHSIETLFWMILMLSVIAIE